MPLCFADRGCRRWWKWREIESDNKIIEIATATHYVRMLLIKIYECLDISISQNQSDNKIIEIATHQSPC